MILCTTSSILAVFAVCLVIILSKKNLEDPFELHSNITIENDTSKILTFSEIAIPKKHVYLILGDGSVLKFRLHLGLLIFQEHSLNLPLSESYLGYSDPKGLTYFFPGHGG